MTVLKTENLSVSYNTVEAINDISLEIKKGEFVAIIGPNGGGKTTLMKTILGFLKPVEGKILIDNSLKITYMPQISEVDKAFPISCIEAVLTAFSNKRINPFKRHSKEEYKLALQALDDVGLKDFEKRQIGELSGGEFARLLIARAIAPSPDIIILDEPTANIDIASSKKIFNLILKLHKKGKTVIAVTHDLNAASSATRVICINRTVRYNKKPASTQELNEILYSKSRDI